MCAIQQQNAFAKNSKKKKTSKNYGIFDFIGKLAEVEYNFCYGCTLSKTFQFSSEKRNRNGNEGIGTIFGADGKYTELIQLQKCAKKNIVKRNDIAYHLKDRKIKTSTNTHINNVQTIVFSFDLIQHTKIPMHSSEIMATKLYQQHWTP